MLERKKTGSHPMTARAPNEPRSQFKSRLENDYYNHLYVLQASGEVKAFWYECIKFQIAEGAWYTPDFVVINDKNEIEVHEVKGSWSARGQKTAKLRFDAARKTYNVFRWVLVEGSRGGWKKTEVT